MQTATLTFTEDAAYAPEAVTIRQQRRRPKLVMRKEKCQHCSRPISRLRTLFSRVRFCTAAHKKKYEEEIDALMIVRLSEAGERVRQAMKAEAKEDTERRLRRVASSTLA